MTNKERLDIILDGGVPDHPPHFEIVFQLEKEIFGMEWNMLENQDYSSDDAREEAYIQFSIELNTKLIEKYEHLDGINHISKAKKANKKLSTYYTNFMTMQDAEKYIQKVSAYVK